MRRALIPLLVAGLLLASATAAAEPGKGRGNGRGALPLGAFQVEGDSGATGEHVAFTYNDTGIQAFRAADRTIFDIHVEGDDEAEAEAEAEAEEEREDRRRDGREDRAGQEDERRDERAGVRVDGAALRVRTDRYSFVAHDTPTAASKLEADGTIRVLFHEGVVLARETDERVRFSYGDVTGVLRGEELATSGREVTSTDEVLFLLDKPRGAGDQEHYRDLGRAIARGHVGAEATINLVDDAEVEDDVISYGNVTMTTTRAERGNITVLIDGHGLEGRVLVLNVDGRILGAESADQLEIVLDDIAIPQASNLTDILDPDDDGYSPEYYVVFDPAIQAFQLIVTVPHYSVHVLSVTTVLELVRPSVVIGVLAGTALLVPAGLVLFRRK